MKLRDWVWIFAGITFFILVGFLVLPILILGGGWLWFFIPFGMCALGWFGFLAIRIFIWSSKKSPIVEAIDLSEAKTRAIHELKYDRDNPDNFQVLQKLKLNIGEKGGQQTPIGLFSGEGTEKQEHRVVLMNLNTPEKDFDLLTNPTDEEIWNFVRLLADVPPDVEVREIFQAGVDALGNPIQRIKITRPTVSEQKETKETEEALEKGGL